MLLVIRRLSIFILVALFLGACDDTPDEEQIAQRITAMQEAIEAKDFTAIQDHLHGEFNANQRLNALEVKRLLQMYSLQHRNIGITIIGSETTMDPAFHDRAASTLSVVLTGSSGLLPSHGSVRTVKLAWVKESGDWLLREADWRRHP